jgi:multidrug efflux pump subunit AcrB
MNPIAFAIRRPVTMWVVAPLLGGWPAQEKMRVEFLPSLVRAHYLP